MRKIGFIIYNLLVLFGIDPLKTYRSIKGIPCYIRNYRALKKQTGSSVSFPFSTPYPCLGDRFEESGSATGHYFHQDLMIANRIYINNPEKHVDVGSRIDGFVAHVASFRSLEVLDIRPLSNEIKNIEFMQADLMKPVSDDLVGYCDSLSCLHAIEHFGLGRYGDMVDYDGYLAGFANLCRILKKGGKLYFSVPIGPQRIEFDAHRVFSISFLLNLFEGKYQVDYFSFVDDAGDLHENIPLKESDIEDNFGCTYGCGIFELSYL
ncbi:MAG: DUF268 domain-containing protein [Kiritimatiellae bacterium]|jgi:SAM-dependent methyltransferase|nr:DUF268 domain-containing protein [Kiritimatiellia bacterium]